MSELEEFRTEVRAWLEENRPAQPDFLLPETFMEVGTDAQFQYLRDWQQKVYEAGYLGMAWPKEYGGAGLSAPEAKILRQEMSRIGVEGRGLLLFLDQCGILDLDSRELVIDQVLALETEDIDLEELKWVVLMVLFNLPESEESYARMEDLIFDGYGADLH